MLSVLSVPGFLIGFFSLTISSVSPFCTIDPNVVACVVPSKDFKYLAECYKPPSIVPAVLKVTDIAGLIKGASEGKAYNNI